MSEGQANNRAWWGVILPSGDPYPPRRLAFRRSQEDVSHLPPSADHESHQVVIERAAQLVEARRMIAVLSQGDRTRLKMSGQFSGLAVEEPAGRGTCPSLFLAVTYVRARAPEATVLVFPSDATALGHPLLVKALERAAELVDRSGDRLVLLATEAGWPHSEFGWVEAGPVFHDSSGGELLAVRRFCESPGPLDAERFLKRGYLRNTMVMAVKVRTLWSLGAQLFPDMMTRFESLHDVCRLVMAGRANPELETLALRDVYRGLETMNFARRVLHKMIERIALLPVRNSLRTDRAPAGETAQERDQEAPVSNRLRLA